MRDPDLVQRAERAAMALERAWGHWRVMHGLDTDPLPPVSSYVGYSLEEPWGQPRVVFGVGAEEAERLAALLAGHDCYGPVHAEVTARPNWRLAAGGPVTAQDRPLDGGVSVPAQAPPPGAEPVADRDAGTYADAGYGDAGYGGTGYGGTGYGGTGYMHDAEGGEDVDAKDAEVVSYQADPLAIHHERAGGDRADPDDTAADRPARSWEHGEPAGAFQLAAVEQPGVIAFPRRPQQSADQWQEPIPAQTPVSDNYDATPSQGPGYCGPRYQGVPPQYQPGPGQQEPPALFGPGTKGAAEPLGAGESDAAWASATGLSASQPGAEQSSTAQLSTGQSTAGQSSTAQPGTGQSTAGQSSTAQPGTGQSTAGQSSTEQYTAGTASGADQAAAAKPEAVQTDASPAVAHPKARSSRASQPRGAAPETIRPAAARATAAQSKGGQPGARESKVRDTSAGAREPGQPGAVRSREGQSADGQSGTGTETRPRRVAESSAVQPKTPQPKPVPSKPVRSKAVQARQTSGPSSPRRATGEGTSKRPGG
ncbi:MAG TPA: hypothetical protein VMA72_19590 [Streptosporangiaceae bacterium]|nr:hypothetical protein [Streptosporangiaceae bacterium]